MAERLTDLRAIKTEKAILKAFHELSRETEFTKINVSALTERAGINRKTFYLHYHSIEELILSLQNEFIENLKEYLGNDLYTKDSETNFRNTIISFAKEPHFYYRILSYGDYSKVIEIARNPAVQPFHSREHIDPPRFPEFTYYYLVAAVRSIFCLWYESGMKDPIEDIAEYGAYLVFHGVPMRKKK